MILILSLYFRHHCIITPNMNNLMISNCGAGEDSSESLGWQGDQTSTILKEINPECSLEGLTLKLKLQYFGHLMRRANTLEKTWCWKRLSAGGEGATKDEMVGWHHQLNGHEFEQALGDSEGQGSLVCCSPWGRKESDTTEQLSTAHEAVFLKTWRFHIKV